MQTAIPARRTLYRVNAPGDPAVAALGGMGRSWLSGRNSLLLSRSWSDVNGEI